MPIPFPHYPRLENHPFGIFLKSLPIDPACNPHPDKAEHAVGQRWFFAYEGENASARLGRLQDAMRRAGARALCASLQSSTHGKDSSRCIIYVMTAPNGEDGRGPRGTGGEIVPFVSPDQTMLALRDHFVGPPVDHEEAIARQRRGRTRHRVIPIMSSEPDKVIPGVTQMPTY